MSFEIHLSYDIFLHVRQCRDLRLGAEIFVQC